MSDSNYKESNPTAAEEHNETASWLVNLRWQVVILGATFLLPAVFRSPDPLVDWIVHYAFNTAISMAIAGLALLFFTKSQSGKFWRNQRIAIAILMAGLFWSGYVANPSRY